MYKKIKFFQANWQVFKEPGEDASLYYKYANINMACEYLNYYLIPSKTLYHDNLLAKNRVTMAL